MNYVPTEVEEMTLTLADCERFTLIKADMRRELTKEINRRDMFADPPTPQPKTVKRRGKITLNRKVETSSK